MPKEKKRLFFLQPRWVSLRIRLRDVYETLQKNMCNCKIGIDVVPNAV